MNISSNFRRRLTIELLDERIVPDAQNPFDYTPYSVPTEGIYSHPANSIPPAAGTQARAEWDLLEAIGKYNEAVEQFDEAVILATQILQDYNHYLDEVQEQTEYIEQLIAGGAPAGQIAGATAILEQFQAMKLSCQLGYNNMYNVLMSLQLAVDFAINDINLADIAYSQAFGYDTIFILPQTAVSIPESLPGQV